ncbi:hypothetical protein BKA24_001790 [Microbacterium marinum]|uniref:Uncharacterized protein n=1 Tax=Microbacterium marinum TaxID=421115 RepID=A0A7W7BSJ6_9MICO|nr:hypothetical protein [Microbacterium marinum]MBB4667081.1 hypothetical protein [Microbacterium marinum]
MQRKNWEATKRAAAIYHYAGRHDLAWRERAVRELAAQNLWSLTNIVAISGVKMHEVRQIVTKTDRTGGRFNAATLDLILEEFELRAVGKLNDVLTARIVELGTSAGTLAKILGVTVATVKTQLRRATLAREGVE